MNIYYDCNSSSFVLLIYHGVCGKIVFTDNGISKYCTEK